MPVKDTDTAHFALRSARLRKSSTAVGRPAARTRSTRSGAVATQFPTATACRAAGVAQVIPPNQISAESIETGIASLLTGAGSVPARRSAESLSVQIQQMPTAAMVAKESVVEYGS